MEYFEVSAKTNYQIEKPFIWLLRRLTNNPSLKLIGAPFVKPFESTFDPQESIEMEVAI